MAASIVALGGLVIAGAGALTVNRLAAHNEAAAESTYAPDGQFVDLNSTRVHTVIEGSGPDLVILHGASGNTRDYTMGLIDRLKDRYRVILFDRPGLGWTGRVPGYGGIWNTTAESPREQARLLRAAAQKLGVTNPILMGHSFAGTVALAWALEFPEDPAAIVMLGAVSNPWPGSLNRLYPINSSRAGAATLVPLITAFAGRARAEAVLEKIFAPQDPPENYYERAAVPLSMRRESLRANARQVNGLRPHVVEMSPLYPTIDVPTEIVHGTEDVIVPLAVHSEPLSRQIPGAVLTSLPGIGHMPQHSAPEAVTAAIDRAAARAGLR